ncbi:MAG: hypothetical protein ACYDAY_03115 [Candidatus Dormibacteria bacterium]
MSLRRSPRAGIHVYEGERALCPCCAARPVRQAPGSDAAPGSAQAAAPVRAA